VYGEELYKHCNQLVEDGQVDEEFPDKIYVLSIDWPLDFLMDPIRD